MRCGIACIYYFFFFAVFVFPLADGFFTGLDGFFFGADFPLWGDLFTGAFAFFATGALPGTEPFTLPFFFSILTSVR